MTQASISKIIGITDELKGIEVELSKLESWNDTVGEPDETAIPKNEARITQ